MIDSDSSDTALYHMTGTTQTIYFDETGFTGNNLLDEQQPVFVYTSVAINEDKAFDLYSEMRSLFGITGSELKGKRLMRSRTGREAASWLLNNCKANVRIVYANKKFALAGKFYEYVFEPVLATNSAGFYQLEFHKFIAMLIYASDHHCKDDRLIIEAFSRTMANLDISHLQGILDCEIDNRFSEPMQYIVRFTRCHLDKFAESIGHLQGDDAVGSWILELSATSLHMLLASWGEDFSALGVYCDMSKPISSARDIFSAFVGQKKRSYVDFGDGSKFPITYNLAVPIGIVDSQEVPGVQIADVISSCASFALRRPADAMTEKWLSNLDGSFIRPIVPDWLQLDLERERPFVNLIVLSELVRRSEDGQDPLENMVGIIQDALHSHKMWLAGG